jgi:hypothetical protein
MVRISDLSQTSRDFRNGPLTDVVSQTFSAERIGLELGPLPNELTSRNCGHLIVSIPRPLPSP